MKTIGLIGGLSWESSAVYYRIINELVRDKLGGTHSAKSIMYSVDFSEFEQLQHQGDWDKLTELMIDAGTRLKNGGADFIVICTNTMHKTADAVENQVGIPLLHIADAAATEVKKMGLRKVALLGTRFTMEQDFYKARLLEKHGIEVFIPDRDERKIIHSVIYNELVLGKVLDSSREAFVKIIGHMNNIGAEGVVLGCTEIPLLISQKDSAIPVFDMTRIHALATVEFSLK
ncbi:MAG TPA: aspartate/glutamate racemase family protein [Negativicutes bacterium]|nr:aspartate/glutamate racemase family protein [Negativicutes bacterium]